MSNPQKRKGDDFERLATETLNLLIENSLWKRIPGSGAIGTTLGEPMLTSDIVGVVKSIPRKFKVECKVGYGGATQFALKKEWLDKVKMEAEGTFSIPMLMGKFSGSREGVKIFVALDVETFSTIINHITDLQKELDKTK